MPVAQLDRASDFESEGCRFESCRAHHKGKKMKIIKPFGPSIGKFELKKTTIAKTNNYCDFIKNNFILIIFVIILCFCFKSELKKLIKKFNLI